MFRPGQVVVVTEEIKEGGFKLFPRTVAKPGWTGVVVKTPGPFDFLWDFTGRVTIRLDDTHGMKIRVKPNQIEHAESRKLAFF